MSYALERHPDGGQDLDRLFLAMSPALGPAMAPMRTGVSGALAAILIDRKALPWKDLLGCISQAFPHHGHGACQWTEDPDAPGQRAVLYRTG